MSSDSLVGPSLPEITISLPDGREEAHQISPSPFEDGSLTLEGTPGDSAEASTPTVRDLVKQARVAATKTVLLMKSMLPDKHPDRKPLERSAANVKPSARGSLLFKGGVYGPLHSIFVLVLNSSLEYAKLSFPHARFVLTVWKASLRLHGYVRDLDLKIPIIMRQSPKESQLQAVREFATRICIIYAMEGLTLEQELQIANAWRDLAWDFEDEAAYGEISLIMMDVEKTMGVDSEYTAVMAEELGETPDYSELETSDSSESEDDN